jgi:hypothetical protein
MADEGSDQEDVGVETCITAVNVARQTFEWKIVNIFSSQDPHRLLRMKLWLHKLTKVIECYPHRLSAYSIRQSAITG